MAQGLQNAPLHLFVLNKFLVRIKRENMAKIKGSYFKDSFQSYQGDGHTRIVYGHSRSSSLEEYNYGSWSSARKAEFDFALSLANLDNRSELDFSGIFKPDHTGIYHSTVCMQFIDACSNGRVSGSSIALRNLTTGGDVGYEKLIACSNQPYTINNDFYHEEYHQYNVSFLHKFISGQSYAIYAVANHAGSNSTSCVQLGYNSAYNINMWSIVWVGGA